MTTRKFTDNYSNRTVLFLVLIALAGFGGAAVAWADDGEPCDTYAKTLACDKKDPTDPCSRYDNDICQFMTSIEAVVGKWKCLSSPRVSSTCDPVVDNDGRALAIDRMIQWQCYDAFGFCDEYYILDSIKSPYYKSTPCKAAQ